jgi:mannose-6-phosphate isomerase-like protein (cupin superfamily)
VRGAFPRLVAAVGAALLIAPADGAGAWTLAPPQAAAAPQSAPAGAAQAPPAAPAAPRRPARPAARPAVTVEVTDPAGTPLADVLVRATGTMEREGRTGPDGIVRFTGLRAGPYRLRFEHDAFVRLERDVTLAARALTLDAMLTPAPPPPPPPAPPPAPAAAAAEPARPVGEPAALEVPGFVERNFVGREAVKTSVVGCTGHATSRVVQLREPLRDQRHEDADESIYVVAGEAELTMAGREGAVEAGTLIVVPRGTTYSLSRKGRNPVVLLSVVSGPPCADAK